MSLHAKAKLFCINMNSNQLGKLTNNSSSLPSQQISDTFSQILTGGDRIVGKRVALQLNETNFTHDVLSSISILVHYFTIFDTKQGSTQFFIVTSLSSHHLSPFLSMLKEKVIFLSSTSVLCRQHSI